MRPPHNTQEVLAADTGGIDATLLLEPVDGSFWLDSVNGAVTDGKLEVEGSPVLPSMLHVFDDF